MHTSFNTSFSDTSVVYTKLNTFLDSFRDSFNDFVPGGGQGNEVGPTSSVDVDSLFGDCKDILLSLLDLVERVEGYFFYFLIIAICSCSYIYSAQTKIAKNQLRTIQI